MERTSSKDRCHQNIRSYIVFIRLYVQSRVHTNGTSLKVKRRPENNENHSHVKQTNR